MRKLKLQMQMTLDGYVARPNGEQDWIDWDETGQLMPIVNSLIDSSDTILLGRKMTDEFMSYWENVVNTKPDSPEFSFAKKMVDTPKVVFTKTLDKSPWNNITLAKGNLAEEIANLKKQTGKDILVYGGADFASSLIREGLVDEYHLFVHPTAIGNGMTIFKSLDRTQKFSVIQSKLFPSGVTLFSYKPTND
ncbi:MAG TPA: dihydrofolate reductase family protein [Flavitalea sp.]|nr:dihydrofolate reductase family protein [Flavitalea sp.]